MKKITIILFSLFVSTSMAFAQKDITIHDDKTGRDEVIELPEGMSYNLDSLLTEWNAKKYLVPDPDCEMSDVNPFFEDSVYIDRLRRIPSVMEMPHNAVVQKFIDQYSGKLRHSVSYMLGACNFFIPLFEEALDRYGLPLELRYLPVIESALDPRATSHAGAVGLWQFMLPTGKRYGLEVNSLIDERRCPIKSTDAAARYLKDLYQIFGDWNLVIAAYNCGPNNVNKAIHRAGGSKDYWVIYPYLPRETRGYVPAFIAANYIMNYYCEHNICPMKTRMPDASDTIMVNRNIHFDQIAAVCEVNREELRALNPQYRTDLVPGDVKPCILRLPHAAVGTFIDAGDSIFNYKADELFTKRSVVFVDENQTSKPTVSRTQSSRSTTQGQKTITIRQGQTLSDIAKRYGTTVTKLKRLNGLKNNNIRAGKKLRVK